MKKFWLLSLVLCMIITCGCTHTGTIVDKNSPVYLAITGCSGGFTSGDEISANLETNLNKALKEKSSISKQELE